MSYDLTKSRIWQWTGIILILCILGGAYWYFRSEAAQTIATSTESARPDFEAPLISDLNLTRGTGSPTFSRADGADRRATVTDFEGLIRPVKNGEARFEGARRVENLLTYSEDFGNAIWSKDGTTPATVTTNQVNAPDGTLTADLLDISPAGDSRISYTVSGTNIANTTYVISIWLRAVSGSGTWPYQYRKTDGTSVAGTFSLTTAWQRFSVTIPAVNSSASHTIFWVGNRGSGTLTQAYAWGAQEENITSQANQNPSEYISTNVKIAAPYHGASVDGVKYFATQNGNTVASNVVTEATGTAIPDATLHGYLAEGARTNLILQSESFDDASWSKSQLTITADIVAAPSGIATADKLVEGAVSGYHTLSQNITKTASSLSYSLVVYAKASERSSLLLQGNYSANGVAAFFNLSNGTVSLSATAFGTGFTAGTASIQSAGNGWYRCFLTLTSDTNTSIVFAMRPVNGGTDSYAGDGTSGLYLWGAQLEQASFASTYIPTTTASVARSIDTLSYPASGNIATNAGTVYAEHIPTESAVDYGAIFNVYANGTNDGLDMIRNITTGATRANVRSGGTLMADISTGTSTLGTLSRNAFSWTTNAINVYKDGAVGTPDTSATMPTALGTNMYLGERPSGPIPLYGILRNVKIWKQVMSGTFVQNLTAGQSGVVKQTTNRVANNTGLVGYWSFEDGTGTKATDFSENNNTGTLTNGPTWGDGKFGKAVNFDGTDDYIDAGNGSALGFTGDITVSAWINPTALSDYKFFAGKYSGAGDTGYDFGIMANGRVAVTFRNGSHADGFSSVGLVQVGVWQHILITQKVSGCAVQIYRNGVLATTLTNQQCFSYVASNFFIGNRYTSGGTSFPGAIDEVRLYNRVITQEEVMKLYQVGSTKINYNQNDRLTSGLVGLWSFNGPDVSGTIATDRSGQGDNGTLTNGPTITPGKVGQALQFDGVNDSVIVADPVSEILDFGTGDFSASAWIKTTENDAQNCIISKAPSSSGFRFGFGTGGSAYYLIGDGTTYKEARIGATGVLNNGSWHHLVINYLNSTDTINAYVDGTFFATDTFSSSIGSVSNAQPLRIGAMNGSNGGVFSGVIDEVRVYNRALTTDEIASLYNAGR